MLALLFLGYNCSIQTQTRKVFTPAQFPQEIKSIDGKSPFLKAHTLSGWVYILTDWNVDEAAKKVNGNGKLLNTDREIVESGEFSVPLDSVALFETNVVSTSPAIASMAIITALSVAVTIFCITNPKACFGSCPTFYVSDGERELLQSEGFSASVAPSLEAKDIDALYRARPASRGFQVRMTNEALETHVLRFVNLLAVPKPEGGRVFATASWEFWQAENITAPKKCEAEEGDCLDQILCFDGKERFSQTDSNDLATREAVELEFENVPNGNLGLVIAARQTFLSTYLFYQTLAYMGNSAGEWLTRLKTGGEITKRGAQGIRNVLGGIEVSFQDEFGNWISAGVIHETGPLAADVRVVTLGSFEKGPSRIRLRLTKGHWRLDWLAMVELGNKIEPIQLKPSEVQRQGKIDEKALSLLLDSSQVLVTLPGDEYDLHYQLPEDYKNYELFLESRGYYLEWMREEWLKEENAYLAARMFTNPKAALKDLAPEYKKIEAEIEEYFWKSKYARP
ncbi:MAG: hypothetical protein A2Z27_00445 [candidate division Zixibacteria bacterium RBG_16_50_21]|nr:MAG: hypothetical protein A2Z27_00445 [candidate division Zixibacteria bacterium RBG_16_50_21]